MSTMNDYLMHYGTPRHSGRYPWGSGKKYQRSRTFMSRYDELRKMGKKDSEIAKELGCFDEKGNPSTSLLRSRRAKAIEEESVANILYVSKLHAKGVSNTEIARRMGVTEGTVRNLLKKDANIERKETSILNVADALGKQIREKGIVDVGAGTNSHLGINENKLKDAIASLKDEGYQMLYIKVPQMSTGKYTTTKVMIPPDKSRKEAFAEIRESYENIKNLNEVYCNENGHGTVDILHDPVNIDPKRVSIRYAEQGGREKDGVMEIRPGVKDLDIGENGYAQVRIGVDSVKGSKEKTFLKGMAVYGDPKKMPDGVDVIFNTNKHEGTNFEDVLKKQDLTDKRNPFKASIQKQNDWVDEKGEKHQGALNIVNEEQDWDSWSKTLASQFLSKQPLETAKKQLDLDASRRESEFERINSLTNPTIKKHLMLEFADECDEAAVALKAAALPRQSTKVILPLPSLSEKEVYAPGYKDGEEVILIRYPHQGTFEIPRLTVNNNNREGNRVITKDAKAAIGINARVAEQLSGADFDGDTVIVIPTKGQNFRTDPLLKGLQGFDPKEKYARPKGTESPWKKGSETEHRQMGTISNLITDMTLQKASEEEIVRATKHALTIIDVGKHNLDWKASEEENGIKALRIKYQGKSTGGASTLISKAKSEERVDFRDDNRYKIDPETGEKIHLPGKESQRWYNKSYKDPITGKKVYTDELVERQTKSTKMAEAKDAHTLSTGLPMEEIYADYANRMKALGNLARKTYMQTEDIKYDAAMAKVYKPEVDHLKAELVTYDKNRPIEREAQRIAGAQLRMKKQANPDMTKDEEKKWRNLLLRRAREQTGASRYRFDITDREWEAIQSGAVNKTTLKSLLLAVDNDKIMKRALPSNGLKMSTADIRRAKAMLKNDYTLEEVASAFDVSVSTLSKNIG